jgi:hypothetical protein
MLYIYVRDTVTYGCHLDLVTWGDFTNPCYINYTLIAGEATKLGIIHYGELNVSTYGNVESKSKGYNHNLY